MRCLESLGRTAEQNGLFCAVLGNHREGAVVEPLGGELCSLGILEHLDRLNDVLAIATCDGTNVTVLSRQLWQYNECERMRDRERDCAEQEHYSSEQRRVYVPLRWRGLRLVPVALLLSARRYSV